MAQPDHLCVLIHGLWGNPRHLDYLRNTLQAEHPEDKLHILVPKSNADNFTYDGIEVGGERVTNEVEQCIRDLEQNGSKVTKISLVGYSLGGLVARYAVGLLYTSGLFDTVQPINFCTFATPHLGVRAPKKGSLSEFWNYMGSRTLSTSGQQMFLMDTFRDSDRPLLSILADKNSIFTKGLSLFKNKWLYANTTNDRSVPYFTAGFDAHDPYVDLDEVDVHHLPDQSEPVILEPRKPVSKRKSRKVQPKDAPWISEQTRSTLPLYAMFFALMPIAVPTFLLNSIYQTYRSGQRIRLHEGGQAGISLKRYRIPLLEDAQAVQDRMIERINSAQGEDYLPTPPPESASSSTDTLEKATIPRSASSGRSDGDFPTLALTDDQFAMIDGLDSLGFTKFPVHIQRHRHTHAAIVVRVDKAGFEEGKVVVGHWARKFEV